MANPWSNEYFWKELKPKLRRLVPHCTQEEYSAYLMLFRVIQILACGGYVTEEATNTNDEPSLRLWGHQRYHIWWEANISGVDLLLEQIYTVTKRHAYDGVFILTTENWEATFEFDSDGRAGHASFPEVSYFMEEPIYLQSIQIAGDVESMYSDMLMAALSVPSLETGEVLYKGSPI